MRIVFKPLTAALLAIGFASGAAHGQSMPEFKLSGFGTVAGTYTSEEHADFITSRIQPNGAGMTRNFSTSPDSKLGVQAVQGKVPRVWEPERIALFKREVIPAAADL